VVAIVDFSSNLAQVSPNYLYTTKNIIYLKSALQQPCPHTRPLVVQRGANFGGGKFFAAGVIIQKKQFYRLGIIPGAAGSSPTTSRSWYKMAKSAAERKTTAALSLTALVKTGWFTVIVYLK